MEILLIFIGFLIAQTLAVKKEISKTKKKFDFIFFLKDTWAKIVLSLLLSLGLGAGFLLSVVITEPILIEFHNIQFDLMKIFCLAIGAVPEVVLQKIRKKYGLLKTQ